MTSIARFTMVRAGPLTTIQAGQRSGFRRFGVPPSGPVDPIAHAAANVALGKPHKATAIEFSLGGLTLRCEEGEATVAWTGGDFSGSLNQSDLGAWQSVRMQAGETLRLRSGNDANWGYLAFGGALAANIWLGSASTHRLSGLGGGSLIDGQALNVEAHIGARACGAIPKAPDLPDNCLSILLGPQDRHFEAREIEAFLGSPIEATPQFDRMGMVLNGTFPANPALGLVSEPAIGGAIQIDGSGRAVLLLADHQTTGGYPKIGVLGWRDTIRLAQARPGQRFMLREVSPEQAVKEGRAARETIQRYLADIGRRAGSLEDRLASGNLISGAVSNSSEF
jgi:5-oxoprolinase (ATP-hydrolysing) subunit C